MAVRIVKGNILPIGIDLGSSSVKLAQLREAEGTYDLVAAGSTDLPVENGDDFQQRLRFCGSAIKELLRTNGFRGRRCILSIPAEATFVHHVRIPKCAPDQIQAALLQELQGKLPFPAESAEIRHVVAGEVMSDGQARQEVIVVAAPREMVMAQLAMARRARLDVAGVNIEACAIVECFSRLFRRTDDLKRSILFVDLGRASTQVVLSHGNRIVFARNIAIAGRRFDEAVAQNLNIAPREAAAMRQQLAAMDESDPRIDELQACMGDAVDELVDELTQCLRYYESIFQNQSIERAIFLGGQAANKRLCQTIAQRLNLPAQIGDPLVQVGSLSAGGLDAGLDRRQPQPRWAVAIGLSLGGGQAA